MPSFLGAYRTSSLEGYLFGGLFAWRAVLFCVCDFVFICENVGNLVPRAGDVGKAWGGQWRWSVAAAFGLEASTLKKGEYVSLLVSIASSRFSFPLSLHQTETASPTIVPDGYWRMSSAVHILRSGPALRISMCFPLSWWKK